MAAEEDYSLLEELAERMGLEDDERDNFLQSGMKRLGYIAKTIFGEPDNGNDANDRGDFFSSRRQEKSRRIPNGGRQPNNRGNRSGGFSNYGS